MSFWFCFWSSSVGLCVSYGMVEEEWQMATFMLLIFLVSSSSTIWLSCANLIIVVLIFLYIPHIRNHLPNLIIVVKGFYSIQFDSILFCSLLCSTLFFHTVLFTASVHRMLFVVHWSHISQIESNNNRPKNSTRAIFQNNHFLQQKKIILSILVNFFMLSYYYNNIEGTYLFINFWSFETNRLRGQIWLAVCFTVFLFFSFIFRTFQDIVRYF